MQNIGLLNLISNYPRFYFADLVRRMEDDEQRFGRTSFQVAGLERLQRAEEDWYLEKMQLILNTKKHFENQRDKVKQEV